MFLRSRGIRCRAEASAFEMRKISTPSPFTIFLISTAAKSDSPDSRGNEIHDIFIFFPSNRRSLFFPSLNFFDPVNVFGLAATLFL
jgi:hypothetical protein